MVVKEAASTTKNQLWLQYCRHYKDDERMEIETEDYVS